MIQIFSYRKENKNMRSQSEQINMIFNVFHGWVFYKELSVNQNEAYANKNIQILKQLEWKEKTEAVYHTQIKSGITDVNMEM